MILLLLTIILIVLLYYFLKISKKEYFLTANTAHLTCSKCLDSIARHIRFNHAGGIMYISNKRPPSSMNCKLCKCPNYINELATLGNKNYCWICQN